MTDEAVFSTARRVVVKIGSSLITNGGQGLDHRALAHWAEQIADLRKREKLTDDILEQLRREYV